MDDKLNELTELLKSLSNKVDFLENKVSYQDSEIDRLNKICRKIKTI